MQLTKFIGQQKLNLKNNQKMDPMSFGPAIAVYQDVCSLLTFYSDKRKLAVERAMKNLLKRVRLDESAELHESVLDNLEKDDKKTSDDLSRTSTQFDIDSDDYLDYPNLFVIAPKYRNGEEGLVQDVLDAYHIDYAIAEISRDKYRNIPWIHVTYDCVMEQRMLIFIKNYPKNIIKRVKFMMSLLTAVQKEFIVYNDVYCYELQDDGTYEQVRKAEDVIFTTY